MRPLVGDEGEHLGGGGAESDDSSRAGLGGLDTGGADSVGVGGYDDLGVDDELVVDDAIPPERGELPPPRSGLGGEA